MAFSQRYRFLDDDDGNSTLIHEHIYLMHDCFRSSALHELPTKFIPTLLRPILGDLLSSERTFRFLLASI